MKLLNNIQILRCIDQREMKLHTSHSLIQYLFSLYREYSDYVIMSFIPIRGI